MSSGFAVGTGFRHEVSSETFPRYTPPMRNPLPETLTRIDWRGLWRSFWRGFWTAILAGLVVVAVPGARPDPREQHFQALGAARDHLFDFVQWEVGALADKTTNALVGPHRYMDQDEQTQYVRDYLQLVQDIQALENEIVQIYVDPNVGDPDAASADRRARRDSLRVEQESGQAIAEAVIEAQISEMLVEYGFGAAGQIMPPVAIRFTRLPTILIVSPRERIERTGAFALEHGLTVDQMEDLEAAVDADLDVSSLIVPLGGLAVYPAMLIETWYLPHVYTVGAHEWMHHYLGFYPLGLNYGLTPELYTINETVASIVGDEIGWAVLNRYYPDLAPPPPDYTPQPAALTAPPILGEAPAFDFRAEMHETRVQADAMLAAGSVEAAEAYMEARRVRFVQNGYSIRKLNQAYFAFYGSYADQPGATGSDPIGPALRNLRYYSGSLLEFAETVRDITSYAELIAELDAVHAEAGR